MSNTFERAELRAAQEAREAQAARVANAEQQPFLPPAIKDPLPLCIYTTVALLAWIFSPPLVVAIFAAFGFRAYWRARKAGLCISKCWLRDTRLVLLYLGTLFVMALGGLGWMVVQWLW